MPDIPEVIRRRMTEDDLRARFEATIDERVDRYREVFPLPMTPNYHFAPASAQCKLLYADGHFYSTVMVSQAVAEGITRFVAERNDVTFKPKASGPQILDLLVERGIVSKEYEEAFKLLWKTRNDVHHMNPEVAKIDLPGVAKRSLQNLDVIEREIFGFRMDDGKCIPSNPKYWDIREDGTTNVFLRLSP